MSTSNAGAADREYLRNIICKYIEYNRLGDPKADGLVPAILTGIGARQEERRYLDKDVPRAPKAWAAVNQAVIGWTHAETIEKLEDKRKGSRGQSGLASSSVSQSEAEPATATGSSAGPARRPAGAKSRAKTAGASAAGGPAAAAQAQPAAQKLSAPPRVQQEPPGSRQNSKKTADSAVCGANANNADSEAGPKARMAAPKTGIGLGPPSEAASS